MSKTESKMTTAKHPNTQLNFEEQLEKVGGFGIYQKLFMGVSASVLSICLVMNLSTVFTLEERNFYCYQNTTQNDSIQIIPNQCNCQGKIEFSPEEEPSAVSKYSLICENEKHRHWARFAWAFGLLCGSPVNGYLADRFGRRSQILLCSLIVLVFGILGPVMPNYMLYSVFRFITSIGCSGYIIVSFVYLAESMDNRGRGYLGVFLIMAWSSGGSAVAFFGKFFRNFLVYDWASAIVFATLGFIITVCAVESPRWRYTQSDEWRYLRDMMFIARINGRKLTEEEKKSISICKEAKHSQIIKLQKLESGDLSISSNDDKPSIISGIRDLFVNKYSAVTTLLIWYIWLAVSFTCYSMVFHALVGDKFLNFFIGSIIGCFYFKIFCLPFDFLRR
ncbi:solute carrier family 22 member 16-like [Convolutriloba macropyga]|uniref:solute carrier family 22 member 16-like n=1 Tax=Convolutriloba macropyga TaxID=536237 RepID=UPI003F51D0DC